MTISLNEVHTEVLREIEWTDDHGRKWSTRDERLTETRRTLRVSSPDGYVGTFIGGEIDAAWVLETCRNRINWGRARLEDDGFGGSQFRILLNRGSTVYLEAVSDLPKRFILLAWAHYGAENQIALVSLDVEWREAAAMCGVGFAERKWSGG